VSSISDYYRQDRLEIAKLIPPDYSKVLEIGCSDGNFRQYFGHACEYWGIEPFQAAAQAASQKLDKVLIGSFQEVFEYLPENFFDLIICNDVIEHFADHDAFLQVIKQKMIKDSYIIGSIPNVRYITNIIELLFQKDWRYREEGILDKTHLRFFTEKSLKRTFIANNYSIEEFYGFNKMRMKPISLKTILKMILTLIFGRDSQFWQFGFRLKVIP
jgi:2-polyprenyl-3-methyl-5-hydroxy-6-metoxy-1,4-benzoquinol methylase